MRLSMKILNRSGLGVLLVACQIVSRGRLWISGLLFSAALETRVASHDAELWWNGIVYHGLEYRARDAFIGLFQVEDDSVR